MTDNPTAIKTVTPADAQLEEILLEGLRLGRTELVRKSIMAEVKRLADEQGVKSLGMAEATDAALELMAAHLIAIRRRDVALIGDYEVFLNRDASGAVRQIVKPVTIELGKGAFQMTRRQYHEPGKPDAHVSDAGAWKDKTGAWPPYTVVPTDPTTAILEMQGIRAVNAVVGCLIIEPEQVWVDGELYRNPYQQRAPRPEWGGLGDVEEIVVHRIVVGPLPETGSPYAVSYTLRYDPRTDLLHILDNLASDNNTANDCYLTRQNTAAAHLEKNPHWTYVPLFGGTGYLVNLRNRKVAREYGKFSGILGNALKKAVTVCERNALRSHPAVGRFQKVPVRNGRARIGVVGWAWGNRELAEFCRVAKAAIAGQLDEAIGTAMEQDYDAERSEGMVYELEEGAARVVDADEEIVDGLTPAQRERNNKIARIDEALVHLTPDEVAGLSYHPAENTDTELDNIINAIAAIIKDR